MQDAVWIITIILVGLIASVFVAIVWNASVPLAGAASDPSRFRKPLFWGLIALGAIVSFGTLAQWPHGPARGASAAPLTVTVESAQWTWEVSQTNLPVNRPVMFAVASSDVNHGFGIYDPDLKMLTQVQAMPGYVNKVYYTFTKPGTYKVMCLEYCGLAHHEMIADLTVGP